MFRPSTYLPFVMVPQKNVYVLETFGNFSKVLEAGLSFKMPFAQVIAYQHSLKEQVLEIDSQHAITRDNVKVSIDGVLYFKI
jgi:regulator of protease activity HflC (stomatin/prohibitin superfamily)